MSYFDGFKNRLLNDARLVKRDLNFAVENNSGSTEDMDFFFDLLVNHRKSEYVFHEQNRVQFMLLKSSLDSAH